MSENYEKDNSFAENLSQKLSFGHLESSSDKTDGKKARKWKVFHSISEEEIERYTLERGRKNFFVQLEGSFDKRVEIFFDGTSKFFCSNLRMI